MPRQSPTRARPAHAASRSSNFLILPVAVFGSSPNSTRSGTLKPASLLPTCAAQLVRADRLAVPQRHPRSRSFTPALVGHRHDSRLEHRRVAHQRRLDLDRRDVLAAGDDHILGPVTDLEVAVGMQHPKVTGPQPTVGDRQRRSPRRRGSSRASRCCRAARPRPTSAPSRGTSPPDPSTTRTVHEIVLPTPCRARRTARSSAESRSHSERQSQITTGPNVSVRPYRWVTSRLSAAHRSSRLGEGGAPPTATITRRSRASPASPARRRDRSGPWVPRRGG